MVKWQKINESAVAEYLKDVDLIIAHNAKFDRSIFEITKIKSRINYYRLKPVVWSTLAKRIKSVNAKIQIS